jgi:hypothetical protein
MSSCGYEFYDNKSKNLVIAFASNISKFVDNESVFEFRKSLSNMNIYANYLFVRDNLKNWYLSKIEGVGNNITHSLAFFKKYFQSHDKVVTMSVSAGGYASILFGSKLNADAVIAFNPQTDLDYAQKICERSWGDFMCGHLKRTSKLKTYSLYKNLKNIVAENKYTHFHINTKSATVDDELHNYYHYENIECGSTTFFSTTVKDGIKDGSLENLLKLYL